ncbi:hypothetical protein PIB30_085152 [Stylosanthes scabra]|uniref:Reverse transcriptase domain-containing protein n=1 Tax=Stylosanthes scabra TaxID=79078 RepID=A0ABU6VT44_9FABA|nr:hypothetical protein [Stylosanthes scabra]
MPILINGATSRPFEIQRGLRQGDSMSPFLFVIVAEILNGLLKRLAAEEAQIREGGKHENQFLIRSRRGCRGGKRKRLCFFSSLHGTTKRHLPFGTYFYLLVMAATMLFRRHAGTIGSSTVESNNDRRLSKSWRTQWWSISFMEARLRQPYGDVVVAVPLLPFDGAMSWAAAEDMPTTRR